MLANTFIDNAKEGKDILIGFNPKFFIDALRVIDEEEVTIYMVNPKAPLLYMLCRCFSHRCQEKQKIPGLPLSVQLWIWSKKFVEKARINESSY